MPCKTAGHQGPLKPFLCFLRLLHPQYRLIRCYHKQEMLVCTFLKVHEAKYLIVGFCRVHGNRERLQRLYIFHETFSLVLDVLSSMIRTAQLWKYLMHSASGLLRLSPWGRDLSRGVCAYPTSRGSQASNSSRKAICRISGPCRSRRPRSNRGSPCS